MSSDLEEDEKAELVRFLLTLELWSTTPGEKLITPEEVWIKSLTFGPSFTEELKDLFDLSWREREIDSYNFCFPSRFLPRWKETTDDINYSLESTYIVDEDVAEEFQQTLELLIEEVLECDAKLELPSDGEILFEKSTTTSFIAAENRTLPQWEAALSCDKFNTKELRGLRCVVPVYPGGIRDTIIADISANNSIRWIERSLRRILHFVPESAVCMYGSTFKKRIESVIELEGWHVLRDLKKCGLTYNTRGLFPIVKRVLLKYIPDIRWNRIDIYSNMIIHDGDEEFEAKRGYGLGMANHLVTLCNIVIHRMARNTLKPDYDFKMKAIVGNDDQDVGFQCTWKFEAEELAQEYLNIEHDIHGALGNLTNFKKSVIKPYGLFYEQYNKEGWKEKESLVCNAIACAYLAPSIRVAKHYISSQSHRFSSEWSLLQLRKLINFWGSEFFDERAEYKINFEIGGWLDTRSMGLKTTLIDIDRLSKTYPVRLISFAAETCKEFLTAPRPLHSKEEMVSNHVYMGLSRKTPSIIQLYALGDEDLRTYYKKLTKFQRNYSSRLDKYQSRVHAKSIKNDIEKIQGKFLRRTPWYCIPCNLVVGVNDELPPMRISVESELEAESRIEDLLLLLRDGAGLENIDDPNLRWDPEIPTELVNSVIRNCPAEKIFTASQFSNTGFIPLVEYFSVFEEYPRTRILGRCRFPTLPTEREKHFSSVSRYKYTYKEAKERREQERAEEAAAATSNVLWGDEFKIVPQEINSNPMSSAIELARQMGYNIRTTESKLKEKAKDPEPEESPDDKARKQADIDAKNDRLLKLAAGFSDRLGMGRHLDEYYGITEEDKPDIFADMSDGEDGDLGIDFG